jgi:hypothetical protein
MAKRCVHNPKLAKLSERIKNRRFFMALFHGLTCHSPSNHRPQNQVSIFDAGVIALQINRAGPIYFRPQRAAGWP